MKANMLAQFLLAHSRKELTGVIIGGQLFPLEGLAIRVEDSLEGLVIKCSKPIAIDVEQHIAVEIKEDKEEVVIDENVLTSQMALEALKGDTPAETEETPKKPVTAKPKGNGLQDKRTKKK